ncbi:hypothetical protein OBBRIDRAFT_777389 [Obba rivulosa]|uniref:F-box domain-containing protein n=1 Tax=Obba rivulosa TaxID=1052685 RepID=A0A8E2AT87_9APHY|nr:hypothetical protein OBBRIDRAFT_777389 [Obba rivulosa]
MAQFLDLPIELLPLILQHIVRPSHFAALCLVSKSFYDFAVSRLYERIYIYAWHREGKTKVLKLFQTLASCYRLALHVRQLVIRDFPKEQWGSAHEKVLDHCLRGLRNCVYLRSCTWTRDGSLTSEILEALVESPQLAALEINGRDGWDYDHRILTRFTHLQRLSIIMPSSRVVGILPAWFTVTGATLRHLTLICKTSTLVTDSLLSRIAPSLVNLEQLHLIGCPKVSHSGILAVLTGSSRGITTLGLEGVSPAIDFAELVTQSAQSSALTSLRSLSLSCSLADLPSLVPLLATAPLTHFYLSISGTSSPVHTTSPTIIGTTINSSRDAAHLSVTSLSQFIQTLIDMHGPRLIRFSFSGIGLGIRDIRTVCSGCAQLEDLWVTLRTSSEIDAIGPCLSQAQSLRTFHLQFGNFTRHLIESSPPQSRSRSPSPADAEGASPSNSSILAYLSPASTLSLVKQCSATLVQFGINTRVWQVRHTIKSDGEVKVDVRLGLLESPEIPEQFQVVRT